MMDATAVVAMNAWILGELVRYTQKGSLKLDDVQTLVDGLAEKKYPLMEEVEGLDVPSRAKCQRSRHCFVFTVETAP